MHINETCYKTRRVSTRDFTVYSRVYLIWEKLRLVPQIEVNLFMAGFRHLDPLWVVAAGGNIQVESCTSLPLFWQNILLIQQTALLFSIGDVNKWHISILRICCRNLMPFTFKCFLPIYLHLILWNSPVWNFKFDELEKNQVQIDRKTAFTRLNCTLRSDLKGAL